jgi:hypothetical protein
MGRSKRDSATRATYRRMNSSGHITRCVVPSCQGAAHGRDGGVAARIEDLEAAHLLNRCHGFSVDLRDAQCRSRAMRRADEPELV